MLRESLLLDYANDFVATGRGQCRDSHSARIGIATPRWLPCRRRESILTACSMHASRLHVMHARYKDVVRAPFYIYVHGPRILIFDPLTPSLWDIRESLNVFTWFTI